MSRLLTGGLESGLGVWGWIGLEVIGIAELGYR